MHYMTRNNEQAFFRCLKSLLLCWIHAPNVINGKQKSGNDFIQAPTNKQTDKPNKKS